MRILHVTDIVSHHQLPLARSLATIVGEGNFRYAATMPPPEERVKLGWNPNEYEPWILHASENKSDLAELEQWWDEADVVLCGIRQIAHIADRLRRGKLVFYMSERWWKPPIGIARLLHPRFAWMAAGLCRLAQSPLFHYWPMGVYAAADMRRITSFQGRMWNGGYYTAVPDPLPSCIKRNEILRILWAGRMLPWKRVDTLIQAFALLQQRTSDVHLTLIGEGPCRKQLEHLVQKHGVSTHVAFHSFMPAEQVRQEMRNADVYVLPSNMYEGWGAVVNEAMSEGCAVVASEATGAAKTMLRHAENGFLFATGDYKRLGDLLFQLSTDEPLRRRLAEAGQRTIAEVWSPRVAAERFVALSSAILAGQPLPTYTTGPMTPA